MGGCGCCWDHAWVGCVSSGMCMCMGCGCRDCTLFRQACLEQVEAGRSCIGTTSGLVCAELCPCFLQLCSQHVCDLTGLLCGLAATGPPCCYHAVHTSTLAVQTLGSKAWVPHFGLTAWTELWSQPWRYQQVQTPP